MRGPRFRQPGSVYTEQAAATNVGQTDRAGTILQIETEWKLSLQTYCDIFIKAKF